MTTIIYEPEGPAVEFIGHAGAGLYGSDPVCAALSILMYTLIAAAPGAQVYSRPGYCRVDGGPIKAQRSGFDGERRRSGESELSQPCGSEGFGACADAGYCRVDGGPIKAQRSGFDGERRRSGESELSQPCGSEGCEACADAGYCRVDGGPIKAQRSGFDGERRRSGESELSQPCGSEGFEACADAGYCRVDGGNSPRRCGATPLQRGAGERASPEAAFAVVKKGLGLLAEHFPENVRLVVKHRAGWKGEKLAAAAGGGCRQTAFSAAAPMAGRGAEARPGNGKCGKALAWSFPVSYGKRGSGTECVSFDEKE